MPRALSVLVVGLGLWTATVQAGVFVGATAIEVALAFVVVAALTGWVARRVAFVDDEPPAPRLDRRIVVPTVFTSMACAWILRGPSPDDTVYGNLAVTVADRPFEALGRHDGLFGLDAPSAMLRPYALHGIEPLAGVIAWIPGVDALVTLHVMLPLLFGGVVALAQFELGRRLRPDHPEAVGIGALVVLLLLADGWQAHGSHGYGSAGMGRALLVNGMLPLVFLATLALHDRPDGRRTIGLALALFAAAGTSSNGLALGPLCALVTHVALAGRRAVTGPAARRVLLAILPVILVAVWAYAYRTPFHPPAPTDGDVAMREVFERAYGNAWALGVSLLGIAGGLTSAARGPARRALVGTAVVVAVLLANPFVPGVLNELIQREGMLPRLALLLPLPALLATAAIGAAARVRLPARAVGPVAVIGLAALLLAVPVRSVLDDPWDPDPRRLLNVYPAQYRTAVRLADVARPEDVVLAPQWATIYVPTVEGHPRLFYARELYEGYLADRLGPEEAERRRRLALFVEGSERVDDFVPTCADFDGIDLVLTRSRATRAKEHLRDCGWRTVPGTKARNLWVNP